VVDRIYAVTGGAAMSFTVLFTVVEYILITYIFGLIYMFVGGKVSTYIQRSFGWTGYCILGSIGVTFHELAHLVTAVLFRHKISEVRLFRPSQGRVDGTLGYVNHSWDKRSLYQRAGNFFIGTAPMFFGAGLLFIVLRAAYPSAFIDVVETREIFGSLEFAFSNMFKPEYFFSVWTFVVLLITIFICPYMDMSWVDVKGSVSGAIALMLVALVFSLASAIIPSNIVMQIQSTLDTFVTYYTYALILGLIMSVILTICFGLMSLIRGKGI